MINHRNTYFLATDGCWYDCVIKGDDLQSWFIVFDGEPELVIEKRERRNRKLVTALLLSVLSDRGLRIGTYQYKGLCKRFFETTQLPAWTYRISIIAPVPVSMLNGSKGVPCPKLHMGPKMYCCGDEQAVVRSIEQASKGEFN